MPHLKCEDCRIRLSGGEAPADPSHACCPACGRQLAQADDLSELMGYQAVSAAGSRTLGYQRLARRLGHVRRIQTGLPAHPPLADPHRHAPQAHAQAQALALPPDPLA